MWISLVVLCLCVSYATALNGHCSRSVTKVNATVRSRNNGLRQGRLLAHHRSGQHATPAVSAASKESDVSQTKAFFLSPTRTTLIRPVGVLFGYSLVRWLTTLQLSGTQLIKPLGAVPLVGLLASTFIPYAGAAIYCGAFAALTNLPAITSMGTWQGIPLALMTVTILSHEVWERCGILLGYGGRIGCSAACGIGLLVLAKTATSEIATGLSGSAAVATLLTKLPILVFGSLRALPTSIQAVYSTAKVGEVVKAVLLTLIGTAATIALRKLPPKFRRGSRRAARRDSNKFGTSSSHNTTAAATTSIADRAAVVAPKAVALSALQASCIATVLSARVLRAHEITPIFTSLCTKSGEIFTLDPRGLVLMGSFLGMRNGTFTPSFLRRTTMQCIVSTCLIFGMNATPLGRVGGILGMTAILSTLAVDAVCNGVRSVKDIVAHNSRT